MATVKINSAYNVNINFELAGIDKRFFAWLIDFVVRFLIFWIFSKILFGLFIGEDLYYVEQYERKVTLSIVSLLPIIFYFFIFENFMMGQSIGKRLLKIRVASLEGYKPTATQYLIRWIFRFIDMGFVSLLVLSIFGIFSNWSGIFFALATIFGIFYILNSKKEQRLGDVAAGTVVIKLNPITQISDTIFQDVEKEYIVKYPNVLKLSDRDITIIKNALQNYHRNGNNTTLWLIAEKLKQVLQFEEIGDPYYILDTVIKDYNYLSTN